MKQVGRVTFILSCSRLQRSGSPSSEQATLDKEIVT